MAASTKTEQQVAEWMIELYGLSKAALNATDHAMSYRPSDLRRKYWLRIAKIIIKHKEEDHAG